MNKIMRVYRLVLAGVITVTLLVWDVQLSFAQEAVAVQMGEKFVRGTTNLTTGWAEIPKQIYLRTKEGNPVIGPFLGLFDGIGMTFARMSAGVYEVSTFLIPLPGHYQPLLQPAYVWQKEPDGGVQDEVTFLK
jgi:putative exosortase-associated protein (TIGR04073 family)